MIKLIVGKKGSGKTKMLVSMVNEAAKNSDGSVVCVEHGLNLTYDISHRARLVDSEEYALAGYDAFYGFLAGLMAGNYDITEIFVDQTLKIGGHDLNALAGMLSKLEQLIAKNNLTVTFTVSCDASELPDSVKGYVLA